jgi:hypothetical protein
MEYYRASGLSRIAISPFKGFKLGDLEFLSDYPEIKGVLLPEAGEIDIGGLHNLSDSLEFLLLAHSRQPLDLDAFPRLQELRADWHSKLRLPSDCESLRILELSGFKPKSRDLSSLQEMTSLEQLSIVRSTLTSLKGLGCFQVLRDLGLAYLSKLESIADIREIAGSNLEVLSFEKCKKIADHSEVRHLVALRVLKFNDCGEMPSIDFLTQMPNLEEFRFVDTDIVDGDLKPLVDLKQVGFFARKHYTHTPEQIEAIIQTN